MLVHKIPQHFTTRRIGHRVMLFFIGAHYRPESVEQSIQWMILVCAHLVDEGVEDMDGAVVVVIYGKRGHLSIEQASFVYSLHLLMSMLDKSYPRPNMKLPNLDQLTIPRDKLVGYLLSTDHPDGSSKAEFFRRFGFSPETWSVFGAALTLHAQVHDVSNVETSTYGKRYTMEGHIETPDGRNPHVRVVWFIRNGETTLRLVTAYPIRRRR